MIIAYAVTTVVLLLYIVYISQQNENYKKKLKGFKSESPVIQEVIAEKPKTRSLVEKVEILEKNMNSMAVTLSDIIVEISKLKHNA